MLFINGKEVGGYDSYSKLTGEDIIAFMKTQSIEDIAEFKAFAKTRKSYKNDAGVDCDRAVNFFELRNWVLEKYEPGITAPKKPERKSLIDQIMEL